MEKSYRSLKSSYDSRVIELDKLEEEYKNVQDDVSNYLNRELKKANPKQLLEKVFDPYLTNAMLEAAEKSLNYEETSLYKHAIESTNTVSTDVVSKTELVDYLVSGVQKYRNYSKNDIINFYICIAQNFLTIFSGKPGIGKTSICNILADSLGLNSFGENNGTSINRYVPVSVERGWSSKRDLIGYYNPLTKKYDKNNSKIYEGLMLLNEEGTDSRFPYFILLDEANLSPIEYYWADFMKAADEYNEGVTVNIGLEKDVYIPKTLRFLATINNDQTTESLSPRLIDRAWIIKLPKTNGLISTNTPENPFDKIISWKTFEETFGESTTKKIALRGLLEDVITLFDDHNLTVSPRTQQSIQNYIYTAQERMENEVGETKNEKAIDFAITQKLLPKINGYYENYKRLFDSLEAICNDNHLKMTKRAIDTMKASQALNMGYCQFLE